MAKQVVDRLEVTDILAEESIESFLLPAPQSALRLGEEGLRESAELHQGEFLVVLGGRSISWKKTPRLNAARNKMIPESREATLKRLEQDWVPRQVKALRSIIGWFARGGRGR